MNANDLTQALAGRVAQRLADVGVREGAGVVAGVSGGGDSVALLCLLGDLRPGLRLRLAAAHLHHGLRGAAADDDAAFVRALCDRLGVALVEGRADVAGEARAAGLSLEMAGRLARRRFLAEARDRTGACFIALAHQADDQAETLLMRLARGSGLLGAGGMSPLGPDRIVRPLLGERRATLRAYLAERGQPWREDDTNAQPVAARNRLRLAVLPAWAAVEPGVAAGLARSAAFLREDGLLLAAAVDSLLPPAARDNGGPWRRLPEALWRAASPPLRRQLLRQAAWSVAGAYPPARWTEAWAAWPERRESRPDVSWLRLAGAGGDAVVFPPPTAASLPLPTAAAPWRVELPGGAALALEPGESAAGPALSVGPGLRVRRVAPGDVLDGHNAGTPLRTLLARRGVPAPCRAAAWVVEDGRGRRWLPAGAEDGCGAVLADGRATRLNWRAAPVWPPPDRWPGPAP